MKAVLCKPKEEKLAENANLLFTNEEFCCTIALLKEVALWRVSNVARM